MNSFASDINDPGQVAGQSNLTGASHAFRYTGTPGSGGVMQDLGSLGRSISEGLAINASGQVAGYSHTANDAARHAFLYTGTPGSGGVMHDLYPVRDSVSLAHDVNDSGQVVGFIGSPLPGTPSHAFLYTGRPGIDGVMHDLGSLGTGSSDATAINATGQIVGVSLLDSEPGSDSHAFLYTGTPGVDGRMIDLDAWLDANSPDDGARWTLNGASGLSDAGLIAGTGTYNDGPGGSSDGQRAFLLDARPLVPEPSGLAAIICGVAALLRRRRRAALGDAGSRDAGDGPQRGT